MQLYIVLLNTLAVVTSVVADPAGHEWVAPTVDASRSPCPMLNAVANHGFISRSGKDITLLELQTGFDEAVHFVAEILTTIGNVALTLSTTGNSSTFNLEDVVAHNVIEHDGSLSRNDIFLGDNLHFDPAIWATVAAHFTEATVPIATAAQARTDRLAAAAAANPEFELTDDGAHGSVVETALYQVILGDIVDGNPPTEWVRILFEQERIPFNEGFVRSNAPVDQAALDAVTDKVTAAT